VLVLLFDEDMRRQLRRPGPYVGVAVAALTFSPVVIWNLANDLESFRFQTAGRWANAHFGPRWLEQFVAGQWLVLNPVVVLLLPATVWWLWRRARAGADPRALWLLAFGAPMALFFLGSSLFVQVKINWFLPAALPLLLGTAWWWSESGFERRRAVAARRIRSLALAVAVVAVVAPAIVFLPQGTGSTWTGWEEIAACAEHWEEVIDSPDGREGNVFFFGADYGDAAQLERQLKLREAEQAPGEVVEATLAQNVVGEPALQFDHWAAPSDHIGEDAVLVLPRPELRDGFRRRVESKFDDVSRVEHVTVRRLGIPVLDADVFVCRHYRGPRATP